MDSTWLTIQAFFRCDFIDTQYSRRAIDQDEWYSGHLFPLIFSMFYFSWVVVYFISLLELV
jgi:hypothetical protein